MVAVVSGHVHLGVVCYAAIGTRNIQTLVGLSPKIREDLGGFSGDPSDRDTGLCKENSDGHKRDGISVGGEGCWGCLAHSMLDSSLVTPVRVWAGKDRAFHILVTPITHTRWNSFLALHVL